MRFRIVFLFLGCSVLPAAGFPGESAVMGSEVRLREGPGTNTRIVGLVENGERVRIETVQEGYHLAGLYYGRWCRVVSAAGRRGWILSCFLEGVDEHEPFHRFVGNFRTAWVDCYGNLQTRSRQYGEYTNF